MGRRRAGGSARSVRGDAHTPRRGQPRLRGTVRLYFHRVRNGEECRGDGEPARATARQRSQDRAARRRQRAGEDHAPASRETPERGRMSAITTHVLDISIGRPAANVAVRLEVAGDSDTWITLARAKTNSDGRANELITAGSRLDQGRYRLTFETGDYFAQRGIESFHPEIAVTFEVRDASQHHHVPLLLSPFGYSTYRGS